MYTKKSRTPLTRHARLKKISCMLIFAYESIIIGEKSVSMKLKKKKWVMKNSLRNQRHL